MAVEAQTGQIDLEKELTCSICTGVLFQPLTLLDCLHTFCGACLKEWFSFQASTATSIHPYTCPSCRASVRDTRPNASYNTLLDMYLQVNPTRGKTEEEKAEDKRKYKPGQNVLPRLRRRQDAATVDQTQRDIGEARLRSLRDAELPAGGLRIPSGERPTSSRSQQSRSHERGQPTAIHSRQRSSESAARQETDGRSLSTERQQQAVARQSVSSDDRQVGHQASMRSLMSNSDVDAEEMADRIMRQIADEGLLEGIDLDAMNIDQEDLLSERIASAYRRRLDESRRSRASRQSNLSDSTATSADPGRLSSSTITTDASSLTAETEVTNSNGRSPTFPPAGTAGQSSPQRRQRRSTSQGTADPRAVTSRPHDASIRPPRAINTAQTPSLAVPSIETRPNVANRRTTDPDRVPRHTQSQDQLGRPGTATRQGQASESMGQQHVEPPTNRTRQRAPSAEIPIRSGRSASNSASPTTSVPSSGPRSTVARPPASTSNSRTLFKEPSIRCDRCSKPSLQYELHYNCHRCNNGTFNLCLRCYRAGAGCLQWYGFGWTAQQKYNAQAPPERYPPNHEGPHVLTGHRYRAPAQPAAVSLSLSSSRPVMTSEDPALRLEAGVFCDTCHTFANACYWKCESCNEGEWGFCNDCVNKGRHCTHPLLPLTHKRTAEQQSRDISSADPQTPDLASSPPSTPSLTPKAASIVRGPNFLTIANSIFRPLTFSTICDICRYPIPPSRTRFHCLQCNNGDYDICTSCYTSLTSRGAISLEDGHQGWRRCLRGHRMIVSGFEDRNGGQRRVVVNELVGGWRLNEAEAFRTTRSITNTNTNGTNPTGPHLQQPLDQFWSWKEEDGSTRRRKRAQQYRQSSDSALKSHEPHQENSYSTFPPDGGEGLRAMTQWSYYPAAGVVDELGLPRNAEVREAEDINGDWYAGVYCGKLGLFPAGHVVVLGSG